MKLIGVLVFYLLHSIIFSVSEVSETESQFDDSGVHLELYHVHGPELVSFFDVFERDEERVQALRIRLGKKNASQKKSEAHVLQPKSISIPLHPGTSIGSGNYYVKLGLGTPAKYYSMIFDTGSSFSWLQCQPCVVYCHPQVDPLFIPSVSKTYKTLSCDSSYCSLLKAATLNDPVCSNSNVCLYTASYGDQSYSIGYLSQDLLTLTPTEMLPGFVYGCGQDNEGLFGRSAGIIGLARDKLSMLGQLSPKYGYAFSYCLPTASSTSAAGFLSIGKTSVVTSAYKFTPMLTDSQNPSLYFLRLIGITVAGRPLAVSAATYKVPTIIDSGTVITRLPTSVYTGLEQAFINIMSKKYGNASSYSILNACFKGSLKSVSPPAIQLKFGGGADLTLVPSNILIEVEKGTVCLAFASSSQIAIIGNRQQQTFKVAYDVSNSRIGFAASGCH